MLALRGGVEWAAADHGSAAEDEVHQGDADHRDADDQYQNLSRSRTASTASLVYYAL